MVTSIRTNVTAIPAIWLGAAVWLVAALVLSAPTQERILLLAPLVIVPALVGYLADRPIGNGLTTSGLGGWWLTLAALPLVVAIAIPRGPLSAVFVLPWLGCVLAIAFAGVRDGLRGLPQILAPARASDLATDAAMAALLVGTIALVSDRSGVSLLGFSGVIVTLTAVHFHFAAFGLVGVAALTARARPGVLPWLAALGLIGGTALTALGFILPSSAASWMGAVMVGTSGLLEAALVGRQLRGSSGWQTVMAWLAVAALSLGMLLAITWATALMVAPGLLDIDAMVRTHGVLNALAVTTLVLTAGHWVRGGARP